MSLFKSFLTAALALPAAFAAPAVDMGFSRAMSHHQTAFNVDGLIAESMLVKRDAPTCAMKIGPENKMCSVLPRRSHLRKRSAQDDSNAGDDDRDISSPSNGNADDKDDTELVLSCLTIERTESYLFNVITIGPFKAIEFGDAYNSTTGKLDNDEIPPEVLQQIAQLLDEDFPDSDLDIPTEGGEIDGDDDDLVNDGPDNNAGGDVDNGSDNIIDDGSDDGSNNGSDNGGADGAENGADDDANTGADDTADVQSDGVSTSSVDNNGCSCHDSDPMWVKTKQQDGTIVYEFAVPEVTDEMVDALCAGELAPVVDAIRHHNH